MRLAADLNLDYQKNLLRHLNALINGMGEKIGELAQAVIEACEEETVFKPLYDLDTPLRQRVELIAREVYGADGVEQWYGVTLEIEQVGADPAGA